MRFPDDVPTLTDGVVTLRAHHEDDVDGVLEQSTDPVSRAWTTVPVPYTRDHAKRFVREVMPGGWLTDQEWGFAVEYDGRYAATVTLRNEGERRAEIAYASHPRIRGTGGMERALRLLLDWGFDDTGGRDLHTVIWWANRGNWASRRLAWRLGFGIDASLRAWLPQRGDLLDAWGGTLLRTDERRPRHPWLGRPVIDSGRLPLRLRPLRDHDADRLVEGSSDPETTSWLGGLPAPFGPEQARELVLEVGERAAAGTDLSLATAATDDDRLVGLVSLTGIGGLHESAELGYWVHPSERGRGVATETVRLAVRHAFVAAEDGGLGLVRVTAHAAVDNHASRRVLDRAGLVELAVEHRATRTRRGLVDAVLYEALSPDWPARR